MGAVMSETVTRIETPPALAVVTQSIEFSASRKNLMVARLKAQAEVMRGAVRNRPNPFAKSNYATLESVLDVVSEPLTANGLVLTQWCGELAGEKAVSLRIYTRIEHAESSEYMQVSMLIPVAKSDAQGIGSAMTYGRRYTLKSALGIPEVDDDGAAASGQDSELRPKRKSSAEAKREGKGTLADEICHEIKGAINLEMLRHIGEIRADEVAGMPEGWQQHIRDEYETKLQELKARAS
jgi:hypothetical protein